MEDESWFVQLLSIFSIFATDETRISRWYFGGLAAAGASCVTHPLDLLKVALQTQQEGKLPVLKLAWRIIRNEGVLALYNGLSASVLRQLTYSTVRFAIYDLGKQALGNKINLAVKISLAGAAGAIGGFIGTPADLVNVRMQNDMKMPVELRRNYKHAIDGLIRVYREEGFLQLFSGASTAIGRGILITIGQIAFYDQVKTMLLTSGYFSDDAICHVVASMIASVIATTLTQPIDVLKTRAMNSEPGEFPTLWSLIVNTAKSGPLGFFRGYIPAFIRLGPHTILLFVFLEQLRLHFGYFPEIKPDQLLINNESYD